MLVLSSLLSALLVAPIALAQDIRFDRAHNVTPIYGTWSSGSGGVQTGEGFANPIQSTFNYPATTGISYSFTEDGHFEEAQYRFIGNGTEPTCIKGVVIFQHGTYQLLGNGSIILDPWPEDGRMQVQDPCAAKSNIIMQFNTTVLFRSWRIFQDPQAGPKLHLFAHDGAPLAPMFWRTNPPTMLPTRLLTPNVTIYGQVALAAGATRNFGTAGIAVFTSGLIGLGLYVLGF